MPEKRYRMTEEGIEKSKRELHTLETITLVQAKERVKHARSFCDFNEDSEYELSLKNLATIEERIATLQYILQHVDVIEKTQSSYIDIGSTITFKEIPDGVLETYTIVGSEEANPLQGKISNESNVAKALIGSKVNDKVSIQTPGGSMQVEIIKID